MPNDFSDGQVAPSEWREPPKARKVLGELVIQGPPAQSTGTTGGWNGSAAQWIELASKGTPATTATAKHLQVTCSIPFQIRAQTPSWRSSPFSFRVSVSINGALLPAMPYANNYDDNNRPDLLENHYDTQSAVIPFFPHKLTEVLFRIDGNWTSRPPWVANNNGPDTFQIDRISFVIDYV